MSTVSPKDKNLQSVCGRCRKEKDDVHCLYKIYAEFKGVKGSSNDEDLIEEFEYTICGACQDELQQYIGSFSKNTGI